MPWNSPSKNIPMLTHTDTKSTGEGKQRSNTIDDYTEFILHLGGCLSTRIPQTGGSLAHAHP